MFTSRQQSVELLPAMNHGGGVDFRNPEQDSIPQLLPRLHANVPQESSRHFAEKRLHDIQPGTMGGRQHILEPIGTGGQVGLRLFGKMCRVIVQHQTECALGGIVAIQVLQQGNELATPMAMFDPRRDMSGLQVERGQNRCRTQPLIFVIAPHGGVLTRYRRQIGSRIRQGLQARLLIDGNGNHAGRGLGSPAALALQHHFLIDQQHFAHFGLKSRVAPLQIIRHLVGAQKSLVRVDWIKMDIEGGEIEAIKGAAKTLVRFGPTLFIEVHETMSVLRGLLTSLDYYIERESFDEAPDHHGWVLARPKNKRIGTE